MIYVLIPAFNADAWSDSFIEGLNQEAEQLEGLCLVFVDDGSATPFVDSHRKSLARLKAQSRILRHPINRGQGLALRTGIVSTLRSARADDLWVTFDADEQHSPRLISQGVNRIRESGDDILFGNRFMAGSKIPRLRRAVLGLATLLERVITGLNLTDSHHGFRVFGRRAAEALAQGTSDRMSHATEFKILTRAKGLRFSEFPAEISYSDQSQKSGQDNLEAIVILREIIERWIYR
jgi:glycosyltransferase involved in cell wall biosynthesis